MKVVAGIDWSDAAFAAVEQLGLLYRPDEITLVHGVDLGLFEYPIVAEAANLQGYDIFRKSMFDAIQDQRPTWSRGQVQNHLGAFGFSGDEVFREIGTLSGGERARVALALISLTRANLLVFDEPTNHLDVENIEVLEDALGDYEGTVLLVSHDRAFLREVATRVWAFDGSRLVDFDGPFTEWEAVSKRP